MDKPVVTNRALLAEALEGLRADPKRMHPKWFYDFRGSAIFEEITELPEYYPTRTERAILCRSVATLADYIPEGAALIELGSGASTKTRLLLDALPGLALYVPVDVSGPFLRRVARSLDDAYPDLDVAPLVGDFLSDLDLPPEAAGRPRAAFFPGSTIGNLDPDEAHTLLARVRDWRDISAFVIGVDLVKSPDTLVRAYDDAAGVTARFNRNLLHRLNAEVGADFDVDAFDHEARWNEGLSRIEMHLVSRHAQEVRLDGERIAFAAGESIHTENSRKFTRADVEALAKATGWRMAEFLTDPDDLFAIVALSPAT